MRIEDKSGDLVITDFDEREALAIASKIERDGIHFYEKLAESVTSERLRDTLNVLAIQERDHLEFFEGELLKLREQEHDRFEEDDLLTSIDYGIFQPYQGIGELEKALDAPRKALRMGIIIEEKSIRFYESCRGRVSSRGTKEGLVRIIEEEREHKRLLEDMLDNLQEHSMHEGD